MAPVQKNANTLQTPLLSQADDVVPETTKFKLTNIQLDVSEGQLVGITGKVGEGIVIIFALILVGKSSLINAILGELTLLSGSISKKGSISYVSQIPYILNATLKENILFGHPYNEERYLVFVSFAIDSSRNRWRSQP